MAIFPLSHHSTFRAEKRQQNFVNFFQSDPTIDNHTKAAVCAAEEFYAGAFLVPLVLLVPLVPLLASVTLINKACFAIGFSGSFPFFHLPVMG